MYEIETIERDECVGRIEAEDCPSEPDHDGSGHIFVKWYGRTTDFEVKHADYARTTEADELATALANAHEHWGSDWDKIERYLRAFYNVVGIDRTHWSRDGELLCIVTRGLAEAWGCDPLNMTDQEATSGLDSWVAYRDGEVYGYVVEGPDGELLDSCWGYYGDSELPYIRSLINDAIDSHVAARHAEHVSMYRELVNR